MKSKLPKPLHLIYSKTMLGHLTHTVEGTGVKDIMLVLGHDAERVKKEFAGFDTVY